MGGAVMDVVHRRCAGLDISKKDAKVAVRVAGGGRAGTKTTVTTWSSMTGQVLALREHLVASITTHVTCAATRRSPTARTCPVIDDHVGAVALAPARPPHA